jgi:hypothetical protein
MRRGLSDRRDQMRKKEAMKERDGLFVLVVFVLLFIFIGVCVCVCVVVVSYICFCCCSGLMILVLEFFFCNVWERLEARWVLYSSCVLVLVSSHRIDHANAILIGDIGSKNKR